MPIADFDLFSKRLNLSSEAIKNIQKIRSSEPSRKVRSGSKNVSGFYPSQKMGVTIQFESRTVELPAIYEKEHDNSVLEFYDQPPAIKINYKVNGTNRGHAYTPDFFVIETDWIGWEEWKTENDLIRLSSKNPNRYYQGEDGNWYCPPGEQYAEQFGLSFRVRTSKEFNWTYQRNLRFLEDYLLEMQPSISEAASASIKGLVNRKAGVVLNDLLTEQHEFTSDDVYKMIASDDLYVDLYNEVLTDFENAKVYPNLDTAKAYSFMYASKKSENILSPEMIKVAVGKPIQWDGRAWTIVNVGENNITLMAEDEDLVELKNNAFEFLVKHSKIKGLDLEPPRESEEAIERLRCASVEELKEANRKYAAILPRLNGDTSVTASVSDRTARFWLSKYRKAEELYGNGFVGLLPARHKQGNRTRKLPEDTIKLMDDFIKNKYETIKQQNKSTVFSLLHSECEERGITPPSYRTFCTEVNKRPKYEQTKKRKGTKASYEKEKFHWYLELTTPRHGDRPFEICHMDHTELDIEMTCSQTGKNLGRPWITFMIDAFSRRLLAAYLTFDSPSYRSCMMTLRQCVKRNSRLPKTLVVDGGKEFHSVYFDTLLARYGMAKEVRPGAKPRYGSVCERLFGTTNKRFIHNLQGNTQITKNVRQVTKQVNPRNHAVWTLAQLNDRLNEWVYEVYDTIDHPALGESPREAFLSSIAKTGKREFTYINHDETFRMLTLPTTKKGTAKVFSGRGVKINSTYYWSEAFLHPEVEETQVPVRYDPFNMGIAYAYVKNRWVMLNSEYYSVFSNRSEREIKQATEEIRKRMKLHGKQAVTVTAKKIANFLESAEAEEIMALQRSRDREMRQVLTVIDGGKTDDVKPKSSNTKSPLHSIEQSSEENTLTIYEEF